MKKLLMIVLASVIGISSMGCGPAKIASNKIFTKEKEIYGIKFYATDGVADEKLQHAMNVMAEYLDNNEDGVIDNPGVHQKMVEKGATMVVFKDGEESEKLGEKAMRTLGSTVSQEAIQDLYNSEIHISGAKEGMFDATYEEVFHLITHVGYAGVYPEVFGEKAGTEVAKSMDVARGGHFTEIPKVYPVTAWYSYDDQTADYGTMITEYMYWAMTSILGAQDFEGRGEAIQHEWKLNTKEKVMAKDMTIYNLLTDQRYKFPTKLPDGKYSATE